MPHSLKLVRFVLPIALASGRALAAEAEKPTEAKPLDGKAIFLAQKCDRCHEVAGAGIKAEGLIKSAPMLSETIVKLDPKILGRYLRRELPRKNRKHPIAFGGSEADLATLIEWIQSQKVPPKDK